MIELVKEEAALARLAPGEIEALTGRDNPIWLSVIAFNARAIRFYEKFGFAVDHDAKPQHLVPHHIMRRPAGA